MIYMSASHWRTRFILIVTGKHESSRTKYKSNTAIDVCNESAAFVQQCVRVLNISNEIEQNKLCNYGYERHFILFFKVLAYIHLIYKARPEFVNEKLWLDKSELKVRYRWSFEWNALAKPINVGLVSEWMSEFVLFSVVVFKSYATAADVVRKHNFSVNILPHIWIRIYLYRFDRNTAYMRCACAHGENEKVQVESKIIIIYAKTNWIKSVEWLMVNWISIVQ